MLIEDKQYVIDLLNQRLEQVQNLDKAIKAMGNHAFINDGLLNEGVLKSKQYVLESECIQRIIQALMEE